MKIFLRYGMVFLLLLAQHSLFAQRDSVLLKEVTIYGLPEEKYLAGSALVSVDSSLFKNYSSNHLGEVLSLQFPVYFRNYGNGMISGISMRGTAPQHTAVVWNGININSFSLGQTDFSILPMDAFDEIKVHAGGGSARFGSGAFGGTVLLNSSAQHADLLSFRQEAGSFGRYFSSLKSSVHIGKLYSSTSVYRLQSKNNFNVLGTNERQPHAAFEQQGVVQNFQYDFSSSKSISANYWYHEADREIQPTIGKLNSTDNQQDRNHRLSISYQQNNQWGKMKAGGGIIDDVIVYNSEKSEILRWIAFANHQYSFGKQWNIQLNAEWNHIIGKVTEYNGEPVEDRVDLSSSLQKEIRGHSFSFNLRKPFISRVDAPLLPYLGANILIKKTSKHQLFITSNVSKNFRAPTFNDRYWQTAGRVDLQPETSHAAEVGTLWKTQKLDFQVRGFYQVVDQWIQWIPDANGAYRPQNIKQVKASGIESSINPNWTLGNFSFHSRFTYEFTQSITSKASESEMATIGKQLIYTPIHKGNASLMTKFKSWSGSIFIQYSGQRYTEASNSSLYSLKPFALADLSLEKIVLKNRNQFRVQIAIRNLLNQNYQLYSGRAMPGRYYNFTIHYQLKQKPL
jgi:vitamin B12 transporter